MVHCYIKYGDPYVEIVENEGTIRKAIAHKMTYGELVYLQEEIGKVIDKMNSYLDDDSLPF